MAEHSGSGAETVHRSLADETGRVPAAELAELRRALRTIVAQRGYRTLPEPVQLASGQFSREFIDAKEALARGADLGLACRAILAIAREERISFDAVGGLTLGADQFAHGIAILSDSEWFVVRTARKGRGTDKRIEGAVLGPDHRVLLIDDVITTGGSIQQAYHHIVATGARIVLASALVDRGHAASAFFQGRGIPYRPVLTYRDLDMEPVGRAPDGSGVAG